uniref:transposase n=1 Tax=Lacipirellula limnantheis TaxID=2528024 RepID=UPI0021BC54E6|nr:transposase [Lacipirellula limnantheis]
MQGFRLVTSDKCLGLVEALGEFYPEADWQRCMVHWQRNVGSSVPRSKRPEAMAMLKAIHAQEDRQAALKKGGGGRRDAPGDEAFSSGQDRRVGVDRNLKLHGLSPRTLDQDSDQQSVGADHA